MWPSRRSPRPERRECQAEPALHFGLAEHLHHRVQRRAAQRRTGVRGGVGPETTGNRKYPVASRASGDGPDTAQYGPVWPNEWPNGEIDARGDERARGARDGRDRSYRPPRLTRSTASRNSSTSLTRL